MFLPFFLYFELIHLVMSCNFVFVSLILLHDQFFDVFVRSCEFVHVFKINRYFYKK